MNLNERSLYPKYTIAWRSPNQEVLQITYYENITLSSILNAHHEAEGFVSPVPHDVVIFNDSQQYLIEDVHVGKIKDIIFNNIPRVPKNLKGIVIYISSAKVAAISVAVEVLANVQYGRKFIQVTDNYEKAERILKERLEKHG